MTLGGNVNDLRPPKLEGRWFIGVVVENNDPMKLQRVRLRARDLHREIDDGGLPWAIPEVDAPQGNGKGFGAVRVPAKGSKVYFKLQDNSLMYPIYSQSPVTADIRLTDFDEDYPHAWGFVDRSGNLFRVNTAKNTVEFAHVSGTRIYIDGGGALRVVSAGDTTFDVNGNFILKASGRASIEAGGGILITSPKTDIANGNMQGVATYATSAPGGPAPPVKSVPGPNAPMPAVARQRPPEQGAAGLTDY